MVHLNQQSYTKIACTLIWDYHNRCLPTKNLINGKVSGKTLRAYTNGSHQDFKLVGDLPGFFEVWLNSESMFNIYTWSDVRKKFRIAIDTYIETLIILYVG